MYKMALSGRERILRGVLFDIFIRVPSLLMTELAWFIAAFSVALVVSVLGAVGVYLMRPRHRCRRSHTAQSRRRGRFAGGFGFKPPSSTEARIYRKHFAASICGPCSADFH